MVAPTSLSTSYHSFNPSISPTPVASSANQHCFALLHPFKCVIKGCKLMAWKLIARGLPCVVPSADDSSFPPVTNRRACTLYVLMAYVARVGQRILILCKAVALFRELNTFGHQQVTHHLYYLLQRDYARRGCRPHFHSYDLHTTAEVHWLRDLPQVVLSHEQKETEREACDRASKCERSKEREASTTCFACRKSNRVTSLWREASCCFHELVFQRIRRLMKMNYILCLVSSYDDSTHLSQPLKQNFS